MSPVPPSAPRAPFRSVQRTVLLPLLWAVLAFVALGVALAYGLFNTILKQRVARQAETVLGSLHAIASSVESTTELQRAVSLLGAEPDVELIVVAGGSPRRILASTRQELLGRRLSGLSDLRLAKDLERAAASQQRWESFDAREQEFEMAEPLRLSQSDLAATLLIHGSAVVRLRTDRLRADLMGVVWKFAALGLPALGAFALFGGVLLSRRVRQPLAAIHEAIERQQAGEEIAAPVQAEDEIGHLARALNAARAADAAHAAALAEAQAQIRLAVEGASIGHWDWDLRSNAMYISPKWKEQVGHADVELPNVLATWEDRLHPEDRAPALEAVREHLAAPSQPYVARFRLRHKAGHYRWILSKGQAAVGPDGQPARMLGVHLDITDQKQAEELLRCSERQLADFFEQATVGLLFFAPNGRVERANAALLKLLGCGAEEIAGQDWAGFHAVRREGEAFLRRLAIGKNVENHEARLRVRPGQVKEVLLDVSPLWEEGKLVHYRCFVRDISDRRQLERDVAQVSESERRQIGQDMHDGLCQELAGIGFLFSVLQSTVAEGPETARAERIAEALQQATRHARELSHGLFPIIAGPLGLRDALEQLAITTKATSAAECTFHCRGEVAVADAVAAAHLYRIAHEAVGNALRHGRATEVIIGLDRTDEGLELEVWDNGRGLPGKLKAGLGLRLMRHRASLLNSELRLGPSDSTGTRLICRAPLDLKEACLAPWWNRK